MKEHRPPSAEEWVSWVLLTGVVTASLLGSVLPAWQLVGQGDLFCLSTLGMVFGGGGLLIWLLSRIRSTQRPDWVSLIAVGVIMVSAAVLIVSLLPLLAAGMDSNSRVPWRDYANADDWIPRVPTVVATLGYVVLVVRRLERTLRWKTKGALWSSAALIIIVIVATIIAGGQVLSRPQSTPVPVITTIATATPVAPEEPGTASTAPVIIQKVPTATPGVPE